MTQDSSVAVVVEENFRENSSDYTLKISLARIECDDDEGVEDGLRFEAFTLAGADLGVLSQPKECHVNHLVTDILESVGDSHRIREIRRARDGAFYDYEDFVNWYSEDLATLRWAEASDVVFRQDRILLLWEGSFEICSTLLDRPLSCLEWCRTCSTTTTTPPKSHCAGVSLGEGSREFKNCSLWASLVDLLQRFIFEQLKDYALRKTRQNRDKGLSPLLGFATFYVGHPRRFSGFAGVTPGDVGEIVDCQRQRKAGGYYCSFHGGRFQGVVAIQGDHLAGWLEADDLTSGDKILYVGPQRIFSSKDGYYSGALEYGDSGTVVAPAGALPGFTEVRFPRARTTVALANSELGFHPGAWSPNSLNLPSIH